MKNKNYYNQRLKSEDLDWEWSYDSKFKTHTLKITHLPTNATVSGTISESKIRQSVFKEKQMLRESLNDELTKLIFGD
jgi:hypothetical protein